MISSIERDINENIKSNMTDEKITEFVIDYTCKQCYENEFDKPGSCEECINGEIMKPHKNYIYDLAIKRRNYFRLNS